ncbi:sensor histidine kinase [Dyadobacter subterraneus]|uniref:histidine kinase n=1 Tax=Dyadobacter subterraneus TaxID=2773304 RepID=A0ABR9W9L7_9BACT|nr:HAMP domain-containing sensor histidine kinase [Dyadobacter subterraneus]MBE9462163.1 HAMP domain-containing histidine kinase [Dyadobacter subterraneus]
MKKYKPVLGVLIATLLTVAVLPVRISEGQGNDPSNLVGSELVIWTMCFTTWCVTYFAQLQSKLQKWQKIALSLLLCAVISNIFYWTFNPFFEDYPTTPMRHYPLAFATLRLSIRGLLVGLVIVPIAFLFENERQSHLAELDAEKRRMKASEEQNRLLETVVSERTRTLENTLFSLRESESKLDNQVYLLSRLVASVTHDVGSPLTYVIIVANKINQLLETGRFNEASQFSKELHKTLISMSAFMNNLLEFTKTQVRSESILLTHIDLPALINEKVLLFEGIISQKNNRLLLDFENDLTTYTNYNLLAVVLHNLLDNAARYTQNGVISIKMKTIDGKYTLFIENSVLTIPETFVEDLDTRAASQWQKRPDQNENQGIGLILARNICTLLGINFSIGISEGLVTAQLTFNEMGKKVI